MCPMCKGAGKSITRARTEPASLSTQNENANSSQVAKKQFFERAHSKALGNVCFPILSDRYHASILKEDYMEILHDFASLQEALKHAMQILKQEQWQSSVPTLIKLMHISRIQPELLDSNMPIIYRTLCRSFKHLSGTSMFLRLLIAMKRYYFAACCEIRDHTSNDAKKTLKAMINHSNFDNLFYRDVDRNVLDTIEKQLVSLKYNT
ncbi:hypothetical protein PUN28_013824 [Cardiocondyla obscurior]|uniref:Uncharacterized protein n=1 Tax=Cardiocondyla obscurior TaxID=286306 RepID=A0AAW2F6H6_9HYME